MRFIMVLIFVSFTIGCSVTTNQGQFVEVKEDFNSKFTDSESTINYVVYTNLEFEQQVNNYVEYKNSEDNTNLTLSYLVLRADPKVSIARIRSFDRFTGAKEFSQCLNQEIGEGEDSLFSVPISSENFRQVVKEMNIDSYLEYYVLTYK